MTEIKKLSLKSRWKNETVVIIATGPSLSTWQLDHIASHNCRTITINNAIYDFTTPDIAYACDRSWWETHKGLPNFWGLKLSLEPVPFEDVLQLEDGGNKPGFSLVPFTVHQGYNSVYQAMNFAIHMQVKRIILVGVDMKLADDGQTHYFGDHPSNLIAHPAFKECLLSFNTLPAIIDELGVEVINCTIDTALDCFPRKSLLEVL